MWNTHLGQLFLRDKLSASDAQRTAQLSTDAGSTGVEQMAAAGRNGTLPKTLKRDLLNKMAKHRSMPEPYFVDVPTHDPDTGKNNVNVCIPVLLLHEMIFWMITSTRILIPHVWGDNSQKCSGQWKSMKEFCKRHSLLTALTISIGLHGDGVPFAKNQSMEVLSWNFSAVPSLERTLFAMLGKNIFANVVAMADVHMTPCSGCWYGRLNNCLQTYFPMFDMMGNL